MTDNPVEEALARVYDSLIDEFPWLRFSRDDDGLWFSVLGSGLAHVVDRIPVSSSVLRIEDDWRRLESLSAQFGDRVTMGLVFLQVLDEAIRGDGPDSVASRVLKAMHHIDAIAVFRFERAAGSEERTFEDFVDWAVDYVSSRPEQPQVMHEALLYVQERLGRRIADAELAISLASCDSGFRGDRLLFRMSRALIPLMEDDYAPKFLGEVEDRCPWRPGDEVVPHRTQELWIRFWAVAAGYLLGGLEPEQRRVLQALKDEGLATRRGQGRT